MRAWIGTPLELLIASLVFLGLGIVWARWYFRLPKRIHHQPPLSGRVAVLFVLAVVCLGMAVAFAMYGSRSVSGLRDWIPTYPNAKYESCFRSKDETTWMFQTSDSPQSIMSFYENSPVRESPGFVEIDENSFRLQRDGRRMTVSVEEEAGESIVSYRLENRR